MGAHSPCFRVRARGLRVPGVRDAEKPRTDGRKGGRKEQEGGEEEEGRKKGEAAVWRNVLRPERQRAGR